MGSQQQLWRYEDNEAEIADWLDGWLNHRASPVEMLTWTWFYGEAVKDSGWTREKETVGVD